MISARTHFGEKSNTAGHLVCQEKSSILGLLLEVRVSNDFQRFFSLTSEYLDYYLEACGLCLETVCYEVPVLMLQMQICRGS